MTTTIDLSMGARGIPGPRGNFLLGTLLEAWENPLEMMERGVREHGEVVGFRFAYLRYVVVADPEGIKHVLVTNHRNYTKSRNYQGLKVVLGEGLLTAEGEKWRKHRKLAQPAFHRERLEGFAKTMGACTSELLARWEGGTKLDAHEQMMRLTFRVVGKTLLSTDLEGDAKAIGDALGVALHWANDYVESVVRIPPWVPTPKNVRFNRAKGVIDDLVLRILADRRTSGVRHDDLLAMLMETKDEDTGEGMNDAQLRDELVTLVLAGHETTANTLSFALMLLAQHPEIQETLAEEVRAVLGDRTPTLADLQRLPYVTQVIEEALRLYPPAWCFEREALEDDVVCGYRIPKGTIVGIPAFVTHRLPRLWKDPETFDPSRFVKGAPERHKYAYVPFGGGPRVCIGNAFAMMEMQIVLAAIAQRFTVAPVAGFELELDPSITLRPKHGLPLHIAARA
jgi:cytochrome P450